ncbi:hypothetical protein [Methanobrevibacter arboriphilus]|uniref:hypothetical protein n=1 Tax=Methanobrevibacter arboriphilus TaxID=39441 RepID=UPI000AC3AEF9|nr:hypothetical protein [Methanobrevibacter arboriphilus]
MRKTILKKEIIKYETIDIEKKLNDSQKLSDEFLKQKHRLEITKELLDDSREEILLLKEIINDFKNLSSFDFIRSNYPNNLDEYFIKYEKYAKYKNKEHIKYKR